MEFAFSCSLPKTVDHKKKHIKWNVEFFESWYFYLCIYLWFLTSASIARTVWRRVPISLLSKEVDRIRKETVISILKYSCICLERLKKITGNLRIAGVPWRLVYNCFFAWCVFSDVGWAYEQIVFIQSSFVSVLWVVLKQLELYWRNLSCTQATWVVCIWRKWQWSPLRCGTFQHLSTFSL